MSKLHTSDSTNQKNGNRLAHVQPATEESVHALPTFDNAATAVVFAEILQECTERDDLAEITDDWRELMGEGYLDAYTRQLEKDFGVDHWLNGDGDISGLAITKAAYKTLLAKVNWKQITEHLVAFSQVTMD
jgi:hypothetical protein